MSAVSCHLLLLSYMQLLNFKSSTYHRLLPFLFIKHTSTLTYTIAATFTTSSFSFIQIGDYVGEDTHPHIVTNVGRGPHQHLRVFEFIGFCAELDEHIELVTYVAYNCIALKKIIVSCCIRCWRDEAQAAADCAKPRLQGKIPHPVQVTFPMVGLPVWFLRHDSSTPYVDIREYMI